MPLTPVDAEDVVALLGSQSGPMMIKLDPSRFCAAPFGGWGRTTGLSGQKQALCSRLMYQDDEEATLVGCRVTTSSAITKCTKHWTIPTPAEGMYWTEAQALQGAQAYRDTAAAQALADAAAAAAQARADAAAAAAAQALAAAAAAQALAAGAAAQDAAAQGQGEGVEGPAGGENGTAAAEGGVEVPAGDGDGTAVAEKGRWGAESVGLLLAAVAVVAVAVALLRIGQRRLDAARPSAAYAGSP